MKNKLLAERARYLKENEKGVKHMCRIMEQMAKEERLEIAAKVLESGEMTEARVKELFNLSDKQIKAIKERVAVLS